MTLFSVDTPSLMITEIGTATMTDINNALMPLFAALDRERVSHIAGINTTKDTNQPAPKGSGKYLTQNEFGTIFENRNWSGNRIIANANKMPLMILGNTPLFIDSPCMANNRKSVAADWPAHTTNFFRVNLYLFHLINQINRIG